MGYWQTLQSGFRTGLTGLRLSWRHLWQARRRRNASFVDQPDYFLQDTGRVTLHYPYETIAVPDHGRYRLHNEMDDCIVCDKCAKVCPVDCIDIEPIRAPGEIGKASDGSPIRLYAARFDIDMAKCCYCGLCTTVCPTECLTMTKSYDFPVFELADLNYHFANLTPEQAKEKQRLYEQFMAEKEALKARPGTEQTAPVAAEAPAAAKPAFRPVFGKKTTTDAPPAEPPAESAPEAPAAEAPAAAKPAFRPVFGKKTTADTPPAEPPAESAPEAPAAEAPAAAKPAFRPVFGKKKPPEE